MPKQKQEPKQERRVLCVGGVMDGAFVYVLPGARFFRKPAGSAKCRNRVDSYRLKRTLAGDVMKLEGTDA